MAAGFDPARLEDLDRAMRAMAGPQQVAGLSTLVARHGQVVHQRCYGHLDLARGSALRADSLFRIASLTKAVTAAAVLLLHEEGCYDLHDPVARWLPQFKNLQVNQPGGAGRTQRVALARDITFHHLLTHTAGFSYGFEPDDALGDVYQAAGFFNPLTRLQVTLPELVRRLCELPLNNQPGEVYRYSLAYDVLGYVIELIAGQPLGDFLRERLFEPLGMADTGFFVPAEKLNRFGPLYGPPNADGIVVLDEAAGLWSQPEAVPSGGGGLVSSLPDYFRFFTMLVNEGELKGTRRLRPATVRQMTTSRFAGYFRLGQGSGYGVGVQLPDHRPAGWPAGLFGLSGATGAQAFGSQPAGLVIVLMLQSFTNMDVGWRLMNLAFEAMTN